MDFTGSWRWESILATKFKSQESLVLSKDAVVEVDKCC